LLEKHIHGINSMLDVGTGTGVLAIAAVKLGAASAWGIDIDEWSIDNANENIVLNDVADKVTINDTPVATITRTFRLITANLTLNTNSELLPVFKKILRDSGIILFSGLLSSDAETMRSRLREEQFTILEELAENEWIAIAARK
jgi:ribosomal protein L11 methyltransferase